MGTPPRLFIRLDAGYPDDPKVIALGDPLAELLFIRCLCWSRRSDTYGLIPEGAAARMAADCGRGHREMAERLVAVGLWVPTEGGWKVPQSAWDAWQQSRDEVERARAQRSAAGKRSAEQRAGPVNESLSAPSTNGATTRQRSSSSSSSSSRESAREARRRRETPMPEGFALSPRMLDRAHRAGMDDGTARQQFEAFCDWSASKGQTYVDWERAWGTWCGRYEPRGGAKPAKHWSQA